MPPDSLQHHFFPPPNLSITEPTNHLDVANVAWLEGYLNSQSNVTCMIVSHDSGFLDNVCTDIYHYETRKLKLYKGNLSQFVKVWGCGQGRREGWEGGSGKGEWPVRG